MFKKWFVKLIVVFLGLLLLANLGARLGAEIFWFQEVGYVRVFLVRLVTRSGLLVLITGLTATYLLVNLAWAQRLKYPQSAKVEEVQPELVSLSSKLQKMLSPEYTQSRQTRPREEKNLYPLKLRLLLPLVLILSLLVGLMLVHYGQIAFGYWFGTNKNQLIFPLRLETLWQLGIQIFSQPLYLALVIGGAIAILIYSRFLLTAIALIFSVGLGSIMYHNWAKVLQYFQPTAFNSTDPLFGLDIKFFIFSLPFWELLEIWLMGMFLYGFIAVCLTYLLSADSLSQGVFPGFSSPQQRHLYGMGGLLMLLVSFSYWLSRYELVYSPRGVSYGASYTDVYVQLPVYNCLCGLALAIATYLLWRTIFWRAASRYRPFFFYGVGLYLLFVGVAGYILPTVVQYLVVQPNELQREEPYIQRTIALTREAFGLETIDSQTFNPQGTLTEADLKANDLTIRNIRLWDQRPLLDTNRQLQQFRPYYRFPDADIDRYTLQEQPNATKRQVLIAARELDYSAVPQQAQTWVNQHLIYTHGYGFTISPVNTVAAGGLPEYFVKDIGSNEQGALTTANAAVRESVPIGQPRIYYGEITNTYVMTGTRARELDYPSGSDNAYNIYDGLGGVRIGAPWRRALFSLYLRDWQMLFTRDFLPDTKVLFRRNIRRRIQAIAPFLKYDSDPYLVAANPNPEFPGENNRLFWIVDAYTTSDRYPYSDPNNNGINYIRNSVKVVIDAYNGTVKFYIADPEDPIINTWSSIFPDLFQPLKNMPLTLQSHIRYPLDFFTIQSERLMTYHMTDPQVFYNREDQWQIPNEIYGSQARLVEPYYLITSLPTFPFVGETSNREEFLLFLPYTPKERTNLIAWLAARSDGENYGKLLLYNFPKERLVYGTEQIEARINQDPVISQQISLWNRQGSRAIQGNLLVIPIEQSLLYVEPIYLEATQNSLPTLVRVVVAYENRIVMAQTLEQALRGIFQPEVTPAPAIIRPVEEPPAS
ncbi:UPF0182 family protein [Nostoc sp. CMAA1605]|uniref:UPF0182 family protein n=1 Tax=Nostoc sp. CMAA1605 TaxID=2055159 RepID=UPI001F195EFF|nr:UPF0182 family protein [Nostoc sp. CMAA1605]MCF4969925.1 hypothetical protein [Nostoc sp. CMAA1605]